MQVKELGHAVLYVHDIARSSAFYRDVLGWTQISTPDPRFPAAAFSSGRTHHELLLIEVGAEAQEVPSGRHVGLYHLGIKIGDSDDELREAVARCKEAGVRIVGLSDHTVSHRQHYVSCGKTDATGVGAYPRPHRRRGHRHPYRCRRSGQQRLLQRQRRTGRIA